MNIREVQKWHEEQVAECRSEDDEQSLQFHKDCVQALAEGVGLMPTYQYKCSKCGIEFEDNRSIHAEADTPRCDCGEAMNRVFNPTHTIWKTSK